MLVSAAFGTAEVFSRVFMLCSKQAVKHCIRVTVSQQRKYCISSSIVSVVTTLASLSIVISVMRLACKSSRFIFVQSIARISGHAFFFCSSSEHDPVVALSETWSMHILWLSTIGCEWSISYQLEKRLFGRYVPSQHAAQHCFSLRCLVHLSRP